MSAVLQTKITLCQWFSTFGSWRPTKQTITQFGDPYITIIVGFGDPKVSACNPKVGRDPAVEKHCFRLSGLS